jgi:hypothetical protein
LTLPPELEEVQVELSKLSVPSLGWGNRLLAQGGTQLELGGRVDGGAKLAWQPGAIDAEAQLRWVGGTAVMGDVRTKLAGLIELEMHPGGVSEPGAPQPKAASTGRLAVDLDAVEAARGEARGEPFRVTVRSPDLTLSSGPDPALSGNVSLQATPARPLLSVLLGNAALETLALAAFELKQLEASARFRVSETAARVELSHAASGSLGGKGYWRRPERGEPSGAFLFTTNVANVGLSLHGKETETTLLAPNDWLERRERQRAAPQP